MREELEQKIHEFTEQIYGAGYVDGYNDASCANDYQRGLNDAWECIRKLEDIPNQAVMDIFHFGSIYKIARNYTATEIIAKIKEYEEKQKQAYDEIKVGDEVQSNYENGDKYIVTALECPHYHSCYACLGGKRVLKTEVHKTGRYFPQIAEVLK